MNQQLFDQFTQGSGAKYFPSNATPRYELKAINVGLDANGNNFIAVNVLDENGQPAFNARVRNSYGAGGPDEREEFPTPAQFNLGTGAHYTEPADPPHRIAVQGLPSDDVHVGNANIHGFGHIQCSMTFQKVIGSAPPPPPPPPDSSTAQRLRAVVAELNSIIGALPAQIKK